MKLLIVEDNAEIRRLIISIVSDLVDEVAECSDGADALARYTEFQPDLVLMDIKMPKTDGIAASRKIIAAYPKANICIVTDYGDAKTRDLAIQSGVRNYVTKEHLFEIRSIINDLLI